MIVSPKNWKTKKLKILVIDNYDSFTYNLVHAIKKISGLPVDVFRNDEISLEEIEKYWYKEN